MQHAKVQNSLTQTEAMSRKSTHTHLERNKSIYFPLVHSVWLLLPQRDDAASLCGRGQMAGAEREKRGSHSVLLPPRTVPQSELQSENEAKAPPCYSPSWKFLLQQRETSGMGTDG